MSTRIPQTVIIATSLDPNSRSYVLAAYAHRLLQERGESATLIDLRTLDDLPHAGSPNSWTHPTVTQLKDSLQAATHVLFAVPVYNFAAGASVKNLIELMGKSELEGKTVGFLCASGGNRAYMGIMSLANSLMLDFRCWIVPRFVFATGDDVAEGEVRTEETARRIEQLVTEMFERRPASSA